MKIATQEKRRRKAMEAENRFDGLGCIEQRKLKALKKISKCCFFCNKPILFWQRSVECYGSFDYVRAHRKCFVKKARS